MTSAEYIQGALKTEAPYGPFMERLQQRPEYINVLIHLLRSGSFIAGLQNSWKRAVFYGKEEAYNLAPPLALDDFTRMILARIEADPRLQRLIHAFVGKMTEAGELQEHLYEVLLGSTDLDLVNVGEESGDGHWYDAVIADVLGHSSFEPWWERNRAKLLGVRYKDGKFTEEQAVNRDLDAERQALESQPGWHDNLEGLLG